MDHKFSFELTYMRRYEPLNKVATAICKVYMTLLIISRLLKYASQHFFAMFIILFETHGPMNCKNSKHLQIKYGSSYAFISTAMKYNNRLSIYQFT